MLKAKQSNADALFVYTNEEESARALRELKKQGYDKPIIGETTLTGQKVIELAGDAANGAIAHVGLTADAPQPAIKAFDDKFQKEYKYKSDHNGMKGYSAHVHRQGHHREDRQVRLARRSPQALHGAKITVKDYPGVLLDVTFDENGDLDRESFMVKVMNGKQVVIATRCRPLGEQVRPQRAASAADRVARAPADAPAAALCRDAGEDTHGRFRPARSSPGIATGAIYALAALGFTLLWQAAGDDQLRAGRVRDAAGVRDAVLASPSARRCWLAFLLTCVAGDAGARLGLQARHRRPADPPRRDPARHRHARPVDRRQVGGARRLQRRGASVSEPVPDGQFIVAGVTRLVRRHRHAGARRRDRRRRCRRSSTGR